MALLEHELAQARFQYNLVLAAMLYIWMPLIASDRGPAETKDAGFVFLRTPSNFSSPSCVRATP